MPATQSGSNGSLSADFVRQFDQAHDQAKSVFATQKELLDTLEQINEYWLSRAKSEARVCHHNRKQAGGRAIDTRRDQPLSGLAR